MLKNNRLIHSISTVIVPIHKEGIPFILITFFIYIFITMLFGGFLSYLTFALFCFCIYFFRNPQRYTTDDPSAIVSAADGILDNITECNPPKELNLEGNNWIRISTFLNVFNVHSQRIPLSGKVKKVFYHPGLFINVTNDKDSKDNERNSIVIETEKGDTIVLTQIAGMIARRIINKLKEGDKVNKGEIYGLIRFGSRVDLYIPNKYKIVVKKGQTMIGGETIIGYTE